MPDNFLGEIQIFGFDFAPFQWALADGSILRVQQNPALYSLIKNTYGGSGSNFALPLLAHNVPQNQGQGPGLQSFALGQPIGSDTVALTAATIPSHNHPMAGYLQRAGTSKVSNPSADAYLASPKEALTFVANNPTPTTTLSPLAVTSNGGGTPHENRQPFLALNICIALQGETPVAG